MRSGELGPKELEWGRRDLGWVGGVGDGVGFGGFKSGVGVEEVRGVRGLGSEEFGSRGWVGIGEIGGVGVWGQGLGLGVRSGVGGVEIGGTGVKEVGIRGVNDVSNFFDPNSPDSNFFNPTIPIPTSLTPIPMSMSVSTPMSATWPSGTARR